MIKTLCLLALLSVAITQDVSSAVNQANSAANAASNAANTVTVGQVVSNPVGTAQAVTGQSSVDVNNLPTLNSVTVGWSQHSVVFTPANPNPTNSDWLNNGETLDIERQVTGAADGEWTLNWSVEDGNDWALWNKNGDFLIVDFDNGEWNTVADLGNNALVDAEIASGAEQIVDLVWNSEQNTINTSEVVPQLDNLVNQVWNNGNLQGFLAQNSGASVGSVASQAASTVSNAVSTDASGAIASAQNAAANGGA